MSHKPQVLSSHFQTMKFEMELRGYSPQTQNHYLCHLRQLEKFSNKPAVQVNSTLTDTLSVNDSIYL